MSGLPKGWAATTLGHVSLDCTQRIPADDELFQYIDIASIDRDKKTVTSPQALHGKDAPSRARKQVEENDVLVSMTRPNLNAVALVPKPLDGQIASTGFDVLRAAEIDPRWIFYTVRSANFVERMCELVQGALYPAVRGKDIRGYQITLAPLPEQKRIADKLDSTLARVDACRDRLDRIPELLKRFRQSVLAAATSGKLTADWPSSINVASNLIQLAQLVAEPLRNGKSVKDGDGQRVLRLSALKSIGIDFAESKTGNWKGINYKRYLVQHGDFLVARGNGSRELVGRGGLISDVPQDMAYPDTMIRVRPNTAKLEPKYLKTIWNSRVVREQIELKAHTTAGIWKISQGDLEALLVPLPSIDEQHEIVRRVETLFSFTDRLEARLTTARKQVEQLTPALLAKAFRGDLVPQDPNDEPAIELLKRLAASRAETPKAKRGRKAAAV